MKKIKKIFKSNNVLSSIIEKLNMSQNAIWKKVAYELNRPRRDRVEVNLSKISTIVKEGDTVLVPGKVLGAGNLDKKVTIAAFSFTKSASMLLEKSGSKQISFEKLLETNPSGNGVIIIK